MSIHRRMIRHVEFFEAGWTKEGVDRQRLLSSVLDKWKVIQGPVILGSSSFESTRLTTGGLHVRYGTEPSRDHPLPCHAWSARHTAKLIYATSRVCILA
jgi:hypothetical protein